MRLRWAAVALGVVLALLAISLDDRRIAWVAMSVLGFALVLRFAMPRPESLSDDREEPPDTPGPDSSAST